MKREIERGGDQKGTPVLRRGQGRTPKSGWDIEEGLQHWGRGTGELQDRVGASRRGSNIGAGIGEELQGRGGRSRRGSNIRTGSSQIRVEDRGGLQY